jgi:vitamin B12 transporter
MKKTFSLRFAASAISISFVVCLSQAQVLEVNPVVVSASRIEQPLSKVLSSVSVITRQDIEKSQSPTLADLLQGEAGFEFARNGGRGSTTSFFLRGQGSQSLLVMIDGVRVQTDQLAGLTMTDMPLSQIERIEILRGNAGALYGESAIGGVLNIMTRQSKGSPLAYGGISYGTRGTSDVYAGYGGGLDDLKFDLNAGHAGTNGFSAINPKYSSSYVINPDNDGFKSAFAAGKLEKKVTRDLSIGIRLNVKNSTTDYDNLYASALQTNQFKVKTNSTGIFGQLALSDKWISNIDFSNSNYLYEDLKNGSLNTSYYVGRYYGEQNLLRWFNTYELQPETTATFGADLNRETFGQSTYYDLSRNTNAYFGGLTHRHEKWDFQGNLRNDNVRVSNVSSGVTSSNSTNTKSTLLGAGYQLSEIWRISSTISSGFRAPNAYEISVNSALVAETHKSQEVGLSYSNTDTLIRTSYFSSNTKNAITYSTDSSFNDYYYNVGELQNKGVEFSARTLAFGNNIKINAVSQNPWNVTDNTSLTRRAKKYGSFDISRSFKDYQLGAKLFASGQRSDTATLSGYSTWAFYASQKIDNEWIARLKLENVFNHQYQQIYSYNTPGRGIFATLQYQPK